MEDTDTVEGFYGVYLLRSRNPKYKGRTYIGYTVDPNRRVKQHNKGHQFGGAWRTSQRGPWDMVLTIHGFPSDVAALRVGQFEWAWQHPRRSRRLKSLVSSKKASESSLDFCLRIMWVMLCTAPWCRLPLTIRWLSDEFITEPLAGRVPPAHMPIVHGPVVSKKLNSPRKKDKEGNPSDRVDSSSVNGICAICQDGTTNLDELGCLQPECCTLYHTLCLADRFLEEEQTCLRSFSSQPVAPRPILPVEGLMDDPSMESSPQTRD